MNKIAVSIHNTAVMAGELAICWLGQAGFLLKDAYGNELVIDPYLSNCGERLRGFKRLSAALMTPLELKPTYYVITHLHFDHFDYETVPIVAQASPETIFFGPSSCEEKILELGLDQERVVRLNRGETYQDSAVKIHAVWADHGEMAPDAIGVVVEMGGHCLYFSGDTAFHEELFASVAEFKPDISFISGNGKFGNLDSRSGANAAALVGSRYAVPCHIWTFAEHGGNPGEFCRLLRKDSDVRPFCFRQGEICILNEKSELIERGWKEA